MMPEGFYENNFVGFNTPTMEGINKFKEKLSILYSIDKFELKFQFDELGYLFTLLESAQFNSDPDDAMIAKTIRENMNKQIDDIIKDKEDGRT